MFLAITNVTDILITEDERKKKRKREIDVTVNLKAKKLEFRDILIET